MELDEIVVLNKERMTLTDAVQRNILRDLGERAPECGGVLGVDRNGTVSAWYFDITGKTSSNSYRPDVNTINRVLSEEWQRVGIYMAGIVHSHAAGKRVPSCGDIQYGIRILKALDTVDAFYLPILEISPSGPTLFCHVLSQNPGGKYLCRRIAYSVAMRTSRNDDLTTISNIHF